MVRLPRARTGDAQYSVRLLGALGNFGTVQHLERKKPSNERKVLNYDTLQCGHCGNYMFAFWSAAMFAHGSGAAHDYKVLPWHQSTTRHPNHWPLDVGHYWVEARRSIEGKNWTAAALMARSAIQLVARAHGAKEKNLKRTRLTTLLRRASFFQS